MITKARWFGTFSLVVLALLPMAAGAAGRLGLERSARQLAAPRASDHPVVGPLTTYLIDPCRFFDTRDAEVFWYEPEGPFQGEAWRYYRLQGSCGVPVAARGAILNVTVLQATGAGHMLFYDTSSFDALPATSSLNFESGRTIANAVTVRLADVSNPAFEEADFRVVTRIPGGGTVHVIVDVVGFLQ